MVKFKNNKKIIMKVKKIIKIEKNQFTVSGKIKNCRYVTASSNKRRIWCLTFIHDYRNIKFKNLLICICEISFLSVFSF